MTQTCLKHVSEILQGLYGVTNRADDVLVCGTSYDEFKTNILAFLDRCLEQDMYLNPDKIQIDCAEVPIFGNVLSRDGLSPDTSKVKLIKE